MIKMTYYGMKPASVNYMNRYSAKKGNGLLNVKAKKCLECYNETYQEDTMCVPCKTDISKIDDDLIDALKKENQ